jgi:hypothetical protein
MELSGKKAVVVWVYVYRGDEVFEHGGSENLKPVIPGLLKARSAGYAKSPGGYTGALEQFDYWYGYGVRPLRVLGPDVGVVIVRMEDHD